MITTAPLHGPIAGYFSPSPKESSRAVPRFILYDTCADKSDCQRRFANIEQGALSLEDESSGEGEWSNHAVSTNEPDLHRQLRQLRRLTQSLHQLHSPLYPNSKKPVITMANSHLWNIRYSNLQDLSFPSFADDGQNRSFFSGQSESPNVAMYGESVVQFPPTPQETPKDSFLRSPSLPVEDEVSALFSEPLFASDEVSLASPRTVPAAVLCQDDESANCVNDGMLSYLDLSADFDDASPSGVDDFILTDPYVVQRDLHHHDGDVNTDVNTEAGVVLNMDSVGSELPSNLLHTVFEGLFGQLGAVSTIAVPEGMLVDGVLWKWGDLWTLAPCVWNSEGEPIIHNMDDLVFMANALSSNKLDQNVATIQLQALDASPAHSALSSFYNLDTGDETESEDENEKESQSQSPRSSSSSSSSSSSFSSSLAASSPATSSPASSSSCGPLSSPDVKSDYLPSDIDMSDSEDPFGSPSSEHRGSHGRAPSAFELGLPNANKRYQCEECGNWFKHMHNLRLHRKSHTQSDSVRCQFIDPSTRRQCDATFTRTYDLTRHAQIHQGRKSFPCEKCGKVFTRRDALQRHLRNKGH
ncbi:hypothetical protein BC936DRAFT_139369 [Jimgerdemannia flammicorona]|uniref:C2H2-type domain-containing protein n=1 Tax=Jimgerdemannia flammicorona TaxID=994334 RepID=A0A433BA05_9FUNG|nr:hypothetical protein BC936DRAFT_139369 [Jimgerdemannia flammicorona]